MCLSFFSGTIVTHVASRPSHKVRPKGLPERDHNLGVELKLESSTTKGSQKQKNNGMESQILTICQLSPGARFIKGVRAIFRTDLGVEWVLTTLNHEA